MNDKQVKIKGIILLMHLLTLSTKVIARHQIRWFITITLFLGYYELDEITHILLIGERKLITGK